jgi:hypothetical protein
VASSHRRTEHTGTSRPLAVQPIPTCRPKLLATDPQFHALSNRLNSESVPHKVPPATLSQTRHPEAPAPHVTPQPPRPSEITSGRAPAGRGSGPACANAAETAMTCICMPSSPARPSECRARMERAFPPSSLPERDRRLAVALGEREPPEVKKNARLRPDGHVGPAQRLVAGPRSMHDEVHVSEDADVAWTQPATTVLTRPRGADLRSFVVRTAAPDITPAGGRRQDASASNYILLPELVCTKQVGGIIQESRKCPKYRDPPQKQTIFKSRPVAFQLRAAGALSSHMPD